MKLELKHLAPYLPYRLKVQYEGIINGKEISKYEKEYKDNYSPDSPILKGSDVYFNPPKEIRALKTGYLKIVEFWKQFTVYRIGNKKYGLQTHYGTENFKPILRPLSDLTKEIENKNEKFVPVQWFDKNFNHDSAFWLVLNSKGKVEMKHWTEFQKLFEWHFDVFGLIEKGLAIDINTLKQ